VTLAQRTAARLTLAGIGPDDPGLQQLRTWNAGAYGLPAPAPRSSGPPVLDEPRAAVPRAGQSTRCGRCEHAAHRGACRSKYGSRCMPLELDRGGTGFMCSSTRPTCTCPWRTCRCGAPVAIAACAGDPEHEETLDRGSAGDPAATLAVRQLANGELEARPIAAGAELRPGEWRACDHDQRCPKAAARGVVDVTTSSGERGPCPK
jgi:hypothetical protein